MSSANPNVAPPCILYVDDERANRVVFVQSFVRTFRIRVACTAAEALDILKVEHVGVIVTDQRMPGMSGNELLIRVKELYPDIVRIVITAYNDLDVLLRAVNDGLVSRYIVKPWDRVELEQLLTWSMQAFTMGRNNHALQLRLVQTERLVTLGSIHAAVIHDINQPLSYLMTNAQRLKQLAETVSELKALVEARGDESTASERAYANELARDLPAIAQDITEGCEVILGLTNSVRLLLKAPTNQEVRNTEPLAVIRYAISVCRDIALKARGTITYDGAMRLPNVRIGSVELTQVLINIIANASHALQQRLDVGGRVVVRAFEMDDMVRFVITDDGPGMSAEELKKVGTPFYSTRPEGTGLGVMQCRRLVEGVLGIFKIESELGRGTTVTVALNKSDLQLA
ncbi:MAG: hybrid sensor histidine kinase/response regulator [Clostridia bacterium]|nr:hybrid sensor histidine kinase/response regulator [Deltaproteobacteria bacterium]